MKNENLHISLLAPIIRWFCKARNDGFYDVPSLRNIKVSRKFQIARTKQPGKVVYGREPGDYEEKEDGSSSKNYVKCYCNLNTGEEENRAPSSRGHRINGARHQNSG